MTNELKEYILQKKYHIYKNIRVIDTFKQMCEYFSTSTIKYDDICYQENEYDKKWYLTVLYTENGENKVFKFDAAYFRSKKLDHLIRDKK